ncbi:MAG: hypothetical protein IIB28_00965 [Chloroflexi bacterium]|nr:hypothetical protein [Chloroflexota bacterium]
MRQMVRVIKIGGSLLEDAKVAEAFYRWLAEQPAANNVIIVGGGCLVESLRELASRFEIDVRGRFIEAEVVPLPFYSARR